MSKRGHLVTVAMLCAFISGCATVKTGQTDSQRIADKVPENPEAETLLRKEIAKKEKEVVVGGTNINNLEQKALIQNQKTYEKAGWTFKTTHQVEKTGLFNNDPAELIKQFNAIEKGKHTIADLEKVGWKFNAVQTKQYTGMRGLEHFYNENPTKAFQFANFAAAIASITDASDYLFVVIPYVDYTTVTSRLFWNKKKNHEYGIKIKLVICFHREVAPDGKVQFVTVTSSKTVESADLITYSWSLLSGPLEFFREIPGRLPFM